MLNMPRTVTAETLDGLAEGDPSAMRSRRDLQRIHWLMGTRGIMARALQRLLASRPPTAPLRLLELGAGDGSLMLGVARTLGAQWPAVEITLLDRQDLVTRSTLDSYASLGWTASSQVVDVFDWVSTPLPGMHGLNTRFDVIVANLFLHHFEEPELVTLLAAIESRTRRFLACEPRRAGLALAGSHLVGAVGANAVTREDAVLSVHAGFRGKELSALWTGDPSFWTLSESSAGLFSHCFLAKHSGQGRAGAP